MIECKDSCDSGSNRHRLKISEDEVFFEPILVGNASSAFEITLENVGWEDILIQSFSITGPFTLIRTNCPDVLKPEQTGRITVTFTPTSFGSWSGSIFIKAGYAGDHNIRLIGAGYNSNENGNDLSGIPIFLTRAALEDSDNLVYANGTFALVVSDPVLANNDFYQKDGISGSGDWNGPLSYLSTIILNGQIDLENLDNVINGADDLANPGHPDGTVTLRNNETYRTLANILALQIVQEEIAITKADEAAASAVVASSMSASATASAVAAAGSVIGTSNEPGLFPNLFIDPDLMELPPRASNPTVWLGSGGVPTVEIVNGRKAAVFPASARYTTRLAVDLPTTWIASCTVENYTKVIGNTRIYVDQYNSVGASIAGTITDVLPSVPGSNVSSAVPTRYSATITKHVDCVSYRMYVLNTGDVGNIIKISHWSWREATGRYVERPRGDFPTFTVDGTNGNDANLGTSEAPFATIERALRSCTRGDRSLVGEIILRGGDYVRPHVALGNNNNKGQPYAKHLVIRGAPNERVRWIAGTAISGGSWIKTGGYTNVYEAVYAAMDTAVKFIFEHDVPEGLIPEGERHSLHRGEAYRVPWAKRLRRVATLAEVDATAGTFMHSAGKVYIHAPGSTNPISSGITYRIPDNASPTNVEESAVNYAVSGKTGHFEMHGVILMYYFRGLHLVNVASYVLDDVTAVGCVESGIMNSASHGIERRCRVMSISKDGFQGFASSADEAVTYRNMSVVREEFYAVYCGDDGVSDHYRCEVRLNVGLTEYNDDSGIAPGVGAHYTGIGIVTRFNGQGRGKVEVTGLTDPTGEGIGMRNAPSINEDGVGTSFDGIGIVAEGNAYNFRCAFPSCSLNLINSKSISPWDLLTATAGYHYSQDSTGLLRLTDCGYSGTGTVKGGVPTITNTTLVT